MRQDTKPTARHASNRHMLPASATRAAMDLTDEQWQAPDERCQPWRAPKRPAQAGIGRAGTRGLGCGWRGVPARREAALGAVIARAPQPPQFDRGGMLRRVCARPNLALDVGTCG